MKPPRSFLDDIVDALDPDKNGINNPLPKDPNKPKDPKDPNKPEPEDNNTTLLLLGAGGLVLVYLLMQ
jgi:hypothetical protein